MLRQLQITVPTSRSERVLAALDKHPHAYNVTSFRGDNDVVMILCRVRQKESGAVLHTLERLDVGLEYGSVDIVELQMTKPRINDARRRTGVKTRRYRIQDRMTVEEIYQFVDSQSHLTFDYLALTASAAIIAAVGLLTNSSVLVAASMLIAPLMGPILGLTFGTIVKDGELVWKGFRNEVIGLLLTFAIGCLSAAVVVPFANIHEWTTEQMTERGTYGSLVAGVAVAIPSGAGVAIAATSGGIAALVGCAISAALLPPISNAGINLVFGFVAESDPTVSADKHMRMAAISMGLFIINWILIFVFALVFFKLKRVTSVHVKGDDNDMFRVSVAEERDGVSRANSRTAAYGSPDDSYRPSIRMPTSEHPDISADDDGPDVDDEESRPRRRSGGNDPTTRPLLSTVHD